MTMRVAQATAADAADWQALRNALWPQAMAEQTAEIAAILGRSDQAAFLARDREGRALGFAEVSLRTDYVNGCETSPVGFLEGIYVIPTERRQGVARMLVGAVRDWTRALGCSELASDAELENAVSHAMHAALGFEETQRVVYFRQII